MYDFDFLEMNVLIRKKTRFQCEKKIGVIAKTYKLRKELVEEFAEATKAQGSNQSKELSRMMQEYIDQWKHDIK